MFEAMNDDFHADLKALQDPQNRASWGCRLRVDHAPQVGQLHCCF